MTAFFDDLTWRGLVNNTTSDALAHKLNAGGLTGYIGFDPTATSFHVGHLFQILNLVRFQQAGHRPIALLGGATGAIGDPSFKAEERALLSADRLQENLDGMGAQLRRFLQAEGKTPITIVNNADWIKELDVVAFLRDVGKHFSVNAMLARDSVRERLESREQGISFTEFSYTLLQAYDFLHLYRTKGCTLQMGASDQWGNIVSGVDLIRRVAGAEAFGLVTPLLTKADGTKFGKSEHGTIWLDAERTSPFALYQFFMNTRDADLSQQLRCLTLLDQESLAEIESQSAAAPAKRLGQKALAREVTSFVHGETEAKRAEEASEGLFGETLRKLDARQLEDIAKTARCCMVQKGELHQLDFVELLVRAELSPSKSAARTTIEQGGCWLNNERIADDSVVFSQEDLLHGRYALLRRGKREYAVIVVA